MYDFQIWEAFMAVLCRLFRLEATTMMHSICIPILLIFSASAFLFLGRVLFENDDKSAAMFYVFMSVFHLFGGYAVYSEGAFLLSRLWQGKAVSIVKKDGKYMLQMIPAAIPIVFFTAMVYIKMQKFDGQIEAASVTDKDFVFQVFKNFIGEGKLYIIFFLVSIFIIAKLGNKITRIYIIWTPLLLLVTVWNYFRRCPNI